MAPGGVGDGDEEIVIIVEPVGTGSPADGGEGAADEGIAAVSVAAVALAAAALLLTPVAYSASEAGAAYILLLILMIGCGGGAMWCGWHGMRLYAGSAPLTLGKGLAVTGLVLGVVQVGGFVVLPFLLFLLALLCGSWSCSFPPCDWGPGRCCDDGCCCDDCCPSCDCNGCGPDCSCGRGSCSPDCSCDCGCAAVAPRPDDLLAAGSACAVASLPAERDPWRVRLDRALAHHPADATFSNDVYRVGGVRVCIGCFTAYPVFLAGVAAFVAWPVPSWALVLALGIGLAAVQAVSSGGMARRRWSKALVKSALGLGLALVVVGTREAPWPSWVKTCFLIGVLGTAWLSAVPRARRMRAWRRAAVA